MRATSGAGRRYVPGIFPTGGSDEMQALKRFLREELVRVQAAFESVADGNLEVTTVAPEKPRDGMVRRADGTNWNPGSGAGVYCYYASSWHFLG